MAFLDPEDYLGALDGMVDAQQIEQVSGEGIPFKVNPVKKLFCLLS